MDITKIIACALFVIGISLCFNLTAKQISDDILDILRPQAKLRTKVDNVQENKRKTGTYGKLMNLRNALEDTGKGKIFPLIFVASVALGIVGFFAAMMINNMWLAPALIMALGAVPFLYASATVSSYNKQTKQELETALSIVTNAYLRTDNIVQAVEESIDHIRPPLQNAFKSFLADAKYIRSSTKESLYAFRDKVDDQIFFEWVTTLIQCQDNRNMKDNLQPIVSKLTDVRLVNNQMQGMLAAARTEYYTMAGMLVFCVPLLYFVNKDWFDTLMFSLPGKITQGICALGIVITFLLCNKFTKPIEYKG